jgi:hypothetical protein
VLDKLESWLRFLEETPGELQGQSVVRFKRFCSPRPRGKSRRGGMEYDKTGKERMGWGSRPKDLGGLRQR